MNKFIASTVAAATILMGSALADTLKLADGNLSEAARLLGVNRTTLYSKIQRLKDDTDIDV